MVFRCDWSTASLSTEHFLEGINWYDVFPPSPEKKEAKKRLVGWNMFLSNDGPIPDSKYSNMVRLHEAFHLVKPTKQPPWAFWLESFLKKASLNLPDPRVL